MPKGIKKPKSLFFATVSIALTLFLLGIFGLALYFMRAVGERAKSNISYTIELFDEAGQAQIDSLKNHLANHPGVQAKTIQYVSKEQAAEFLKPDFGDVVSTLGSNPFYNSIEFKAASGSLINGNGQSAFQEELPAQFSFVRYVYYEGNSAQQISSNFNKILMGGLAFSIFLLYVISIIIHNTVKLSLYANRFTIKNMQLVGAEPQFIAKPFIAQSMMTGFIGALAAFILTATAWFLFKKGWESFITIQQVSAVLGITLVFMLLLGVGISFLSTRAGVWGYLKQPMDEVY